MDPITMGAIIAGGSQLASSAFGIFGQSKTNKDQIDLAREQMAWQERMSNTAHQREVKDLREAGLNPILSARLGGAGTPSGTMPVISNPYKDIGIDRAVNTAMSVMRQKKELGLLDAQIAKTSSEARYANAEANAREILGQAETSAYGRWMRKAGHYVGATIGIGRDVLGLIKDGVSIARPGVNISTARQINSPGSFRINHPRKW